MEFAANQAAPPDLAAALDRLWVRFLPELRERVVILESAAQLLSQGALRPELQEAAQAAAHKLAGVLGTFSLDRGTDLARELELLYTTVPDPSSAARVAQQTSELRALVENRK
jgi:HPt (histidine-containing phosphotransfer) domain-containing protein